MANNTPTNVSNLDVSSYRESLNEFLKGNPALKDYSYEGSNISVELDILSFNTYNNAFLLNMVASEMWQDSAVLRDSAVSHSKELNYVPRSRVSSTALVNVTVSPTDNPSIVVIPKFYSFVSQSQSTGRSYIFSTDEPIVIRNNGGSFVANNVQIFEGRVVTEFFVANSSVRYLISSPNVDISSIQVNVQNSQTDTANTNYDYAENLYGLSDASTVYFLQGAEANKYEILFGNGITGRKMVDGNVVKVTYRDCSASDGDGIALFSPAGAISGYTNVTVATVNNQRSSGGAERESIESIKFNAPRHYATQGRAINQGDYETIIRQKFPVVQSLSVYGGENLPQKQYGKVAISAKPYGGQTLTQAVKNSIASYISEINSVEIIPIFVDPEFFYTEIKSDVYYNTDATSKTTNDMEATVLTAIMSFGTNNLSDYRKNLYRSRLETAINSADNSIVSNQTMTRVIKRKSPFIGVGQTVIINYNTALNTTVIGQRAIESSAFTYTLNGADYSVYFGDDGKGALNLYPINENGAELALVANVGTVDYTKGIVTTTSLIYTAYQNYISFYARPVSKDYSINLNQILLIDPTDVSINLYKA